MPVRKHNSGKGGAKSTMEGVSVAVRVRPLSTVEHADPSIRNCIQCLRDSIVIGSQSGRPPAAGAATPPASPMHRPHQYHVDHVFHTHSSQIEVYDQACKHVVEGVFHGINGSILAYGPTGSGKTHTMFGSSMSAAGIVYQAVQDIFLEKQRLEEEEGKIVKLKCSFVEIYNEEVFDLLVCPEAAISCPASPSAMSTGNLNAAASPGKRRALQVRDAGGQPFSSNDGGHSVHHVRTVSSPTSSPAMSSSSPSTAMTMSMVNDESLHVIGLSHIYPETLEDFTRGIEYGHTHRFVASTGANAQSSRSHAIITVEVQVRDGIPLRHGEDGTAITGEAGEEDAHIRGSWKKKKKSSTSLGTIARIRFGDLAGCERAAATSNTGIRLREGANINRSLLALGAVVQALAQKKRLDAATASTYFVPYRGSKLTRLLRDGLGGNCRTLMLFCLSPSTKSVEECLNTMHFAMNAKEIRVDAKRNEFHVNSANVAKNQEELIEDLRSELAIVKAELQQQQLQRGDSLSGTWGMPAASTSSPSSMAPLGGFEGGGGGAGTRSPTPATSFDSAIAGGNSVSGVAKPTLSRQSSGASLSPTSTFAMSNGMSFATATFAKGSMNGSGAIVADGFRGRSPAPLSASLCGASAPHGYTAAASCAFASDGGTSPRVPGMETAMRSGVSPSVSRRGNSFRIPRASVFAETGPLFSELESRLKSFTAEKETLFHQLRDAQERQHDGDIKLREKRWQLAKFLASIAAASRLRVGSSGAADELQDGAPIGVAGLRRTITSIEENGKGCQDEIDRLTIQLDDVDRKVAATRQELLRERQDTSLELLLDNTRLRQDCTEAECLAAHYHQECRTLMNREEEYSEALARCVGALQDLQPHFVTLGGAAGPATEEARLALLYALLPTAATADMIPLFESSLKEQMAPPPTQQISSSHPPLAPNPVPRAVLPDTPAEAAAAAAILSNLNSLDAAHGRALSPRGTPTGAPPTDRLAEQFENLLQTANAFHIDVSASLDGGGEGEAAGAAAGGRRRGGPHTPRGGPDAALPRRPEMVDCATSPVRAEESATAAAATVSPSKKVSPFARTYSLTGLTTPKRAANDSGESKKKKKKAPSTPRPQTFQRCASAFAALSSGKSSLAAGNGVARTPGKSGASPFQRSASATGTGTSAYSPLREKQGGPQRFARTASAPVRVQSGGGATPSKTPNRTRGTPAKQQAGPLRGVASPPTRTPKSAVKPTSRPASPAKRPPPVSSASSAKKGHQNAGRMGSSPKTALGGVNKTATNKSALTSFVRTNTAFALRSQAALNAGKEAWQPKQGGDAALLSSSHKRTLSDKKKKAPARSSEDTMDSTSSPLQTPSSGGSRAKLTAAFAPAQDLQEGAASLSHYDMVEVAPPPPLSESEDGFNGTFREVEDWSDEEGYHGYYHSGCSDGDTDEEERNGGLEAKEERFSNCISSRRAESPGQYGEHSKGQEERAGRNGRHPSPLPEDEEAEPFMETSSGLSMTSPLFGGGKENDATASGSATKLHHQGKNKNEVGYGNGLPSFAALPTTSPSCERPATLEKALLAVGDSPLARRRRSSGVSVLDELQVSRSTCYSGSISPVSQTIKKG